MRTVGALVFTLLALAAPALQAQPEVVPAEHPVYPFLHAQRVAGRLPEYRNETLPYDRRTVRRHLDSLSAREADLPRAGRYWLAEFRREFFEPEDGVERVFGDGGVHVPTGRDTEKFVAYYRDADWRATLSVGGALQYRVADDTTGYSGAALLPTLALEGNYRNRIGWYSSTFNGIQVTGDTRVLQRDPVLNPLYYVGRQDVPPGTFDRTTASLRVGGPVFFAGIAHERLRIGPSADRPLMLADGADYFSSVQLGFATRFLQYRFVHGALGERSRDIPGDSLEVLVAPERYIALHRLEANLSRRVSLGFSEAVVYGLRGPELAYLNPLFPIKPAEHTLWDRDNALFALDAVVRPVDGLEAYGTFLADDLDFSRLGRQSFNNKWAAQAGLLVVADRIAPGAELWTEYTRIGPFVYTHRFQLDGAFYNSYIHNGFGLGHPLGPNADQIAAGVRLWLPFRAHLAVSGRYARRAENYLDENGAFVNVGGDVRDGSQPGFDVFENVFLSGDRYEGVGARLEFQWEPVREAGVRFYGDVQTWDRAPTQTFVRVEAYVNL
ncbi:MAG TPA: capsule assembly Wzi family protein [Rhodothermales bacterium]|nr:capsule assembly Wzi family protein [Rhodothermales bacterium]